MYGDYETRKNMDGTFSAFKLEGPAEGVPSMDLIISAETEDKLHQIMARLYVAYSEGVVEGIKEQKEEFRNKLGL